MKVFVDGYNLGLEKGTGVATYARNLTFALHAMGHDVGVLYGGSAAPGMSDLLKEIAFFDTHAGVVPRWLRNLRIVREMFVAPLGFEATRVPLTGAVIADTFKSRLPYYDSIWNSTDLFRRANNAYGVWRKMSPVYLPSKPEIMHWTYPLPLKAKGALNIYTIHDLVPLRLPYTTLDNKKKFLRLCRRIASKADHIVTVSETSRQDIISLLGVSPDRVTNTFQAVSIPEKYSQKPLEVVQREVEGTFGLQFKNYFLFYGSIEPKKNIGRLIEGYLASGVDAPLVIVGAQAWKSEQELRLLYDDHIRTLIQTGSETKVKRRVIQLDYAPFPLLVSLIRGAKAVTFPSIYEGFGLPVLEAMHLGTPVLSSNTSSMPEVAGDAAYLVNPYDTQAIADGIRTLDSDPSLCNNLSLSGRIQAEKFSETQYINRLSQLYDRLS